MSIPVVTAEEMHRLEKLAVAGGYSEEAFMLEAGRNVASIVMEFLEKRKLKPNVALLIGKGNNGGDAWVTGLCLLEKGIDVRAFALYSQEVSSLLNRKFRTKFVKRKPIEKEINFEGCSLIVDGLLGTGFKGKVAPEMALAIGQANLSGLPIVAIDIPSGLDGTTGEVRGMAIVAQETVALGCFKSGFFLREGWNHVGFIQVRDFGLPKEILVKAEVFGFVPEEKEIWDFLPKIRRNRHKYQTGYVVGLSGSRILRGAPKLAGLAALRTGAGIVRVFHLEEIGEFPMELICQKWNAKLWNQELKRAGSLFIGPGMGTSKLMRAFLKKQLKNVALPIVVDADAIQGDIEYPAQAILTPHRGEVLRLLGIKSDRSEEDLLARCQKWVNQKGCVLVLKGAPTFIFSKNKAPLVIPRGDPGMAKAGTGDVLTGVIAALLAQRVKGEDAAILGVFLHALAGEMAAKNKSSHGMIASDLIDCLGGVKQ